MTILIIISDYVKTIVNLLIIFVLLYWCLNDQDQFNYYNNFTFNYCFSLYL